MTKNRLVAMEVLTALMATEAAEAVMVQAMETTTVIRQMVMDHKAAAEAMEAMETTEAMEATEAVVEAAAVMVQVVMVVMVVMVMVEIAQMVALMVQILI